MALDRVGFRDWWKKIQERYHVRANIGMDGKCYGKFGTSFDNQIIVIDNDGPTPNEADVITGSELSPHEAYQRIAPLASEDVSARSRRSACGRPDTQSEAPGSGERNGKGLRLATSESSHVSQAEGIGELLTPASHRATEIEAGTVFSRYRVQKAIVRGAEPHPANVVESTTMASVEPPDITYRHHLPPELISEGRVSDLQVEDTIYAGGRDHPTGRKPPRSLER